MTVAAAFDQSLKIDCGLLKQTLVYENSFLIVEGFYDRH